MKKIRRVVFLASIVFLVVIFVGEMRKMRTMAKDVRAATDNELPLTQVVTREDSSLISPKYISRVRSHQNVNSKIMDPVSFLYVDDTYHLIIFTLHLEADGPLSKVIKSKTENSSRSDGETYSMVDFNGFSRFEWRPMPTMPARNIFLALYGDSLTNGVLNDSIATYHLLCKNFSIKYEVKGVVQVFMTCGKNTTSDLLFLKRGKTVYFMLMTAAKPGYFIPNELLYDLIMGI